MMFWNAKYATTSKPSSTATMIVSAVPQPHRFVHSQSSGVECITSASTTLPLPSCVIGSIKAGTPEGVG